MTTAQTVEFRASAQFNPVFRPVNEWRGRYRILKGSAGSGKSVNIAQDYIAKLSDPAYQGANLVVVRKIEETNRDSTFAELQAAIYRMFGPYADRFWKVNLNPLALECKISASVRRSSPSPSRTGNWSGYGVRKRQNFFRKTSTFWTTVFVATWTT